MLNHANGPSRHGNSAAKPLHIQHRRDNWCLKQLNSSLMFKVSYTIHVSYINVIHTETQIHIVSVCKTKLLYISHSQEPHTQILMMGEGGSNKGSHFIPKKITTSEFVYPKTSLLFLAFFCDPKISWHLS